MTNAATLGWDVGGAHLKAVLLGDDGKVRRVFQLACPLWRGLEHLQQAASSVLRALQGTPLRHAVTMTGELADIFPDREQGVTRLVQAMAGLAGPDAMAIYAGRAGFVVPTACGQHMDDIASANWHASAAFVGTHFPQALFVDIGSTTADLIPLLEGKPVARGYSDAARMRHEELVYTGAVRTPVMAVAPWLPFEGEWQRTAAEHFATMADVYRLTGELPPAHDLAETADGRGKTAAESAARLARVVGRDYRDATPQQWQQLAQAVRSQQLRQLQTALERHWSRPELAADAPVVGAGAGAFLARCLAEAAGRAYIPACSLIAGDAELARQAEVCFPACAVAWLAARGAA